MNFVINGRFLSQKISGVQRFAIEITKALFDQRSDFVVLCPQDSDLSKDYLLNWNIKKIGTQTGHLWEQWDLTRYLSTNGNPVLLNLCNTGPLFYSNNIVTVHDACFARHKEWYSLQFSSYYNFLVPKLLKKSRVVLTVSNFSKEEIVTFFNIKIDKISVIPNAVSKIFSEYESDNFVSKKQNIILSVASIDPRKNQKILISAFKEVNNKDWTLYLVGARHQAFSNQDYMETTSSSHIRWTGYLEDKELIALYHKASFFVYPSLYEGFGIPPLEAMSVGCPVIVSDIPSLRETYGDAAIYFDPTNSTQLANQIERLIGDEELRIKLVKVGLAKSKEYSWEESARKVLKAIATI